MKESIPAYYSAGAGSAVVLLHCTLGSKNQWRELTALLEQQYRVIAVDLYGYGGTPPPEKGDRHALTDEAGLVLSLLDRILPPEEPFHLVGHSFGGAVALCLCHAALHRVKTLTAFEPVSFHLLPPEDPALGPVYALQHELARLMGEARPAEAAATFLDYWSGPGSFSRYPRRVQEDFARRAPKLLLDFQALTGATLTLEDCRELDLPVTLIAGRESREPALRVAEALNRALPACQLKWVAAGHMAPVTHPELVNPIIRKSLLPRGDRPGAHPLPFGQPL